MPHPPKIQRNKELVNKIESGWTYEEVGKHFNIAKSTVHEVYHKWSPTLGKKVRVIPS